MSWLTSPWSALAVTAAKAALMFGTALLVLRLGERRTLAQWTLIDVIAAVALGAVVGRTAVAADQSYATGAVALATVVTMHRLASLLRFSGLFGKLTDHRIRVLVANGRVRRGQLRRCGLTDNDLFAALRLKGVHDLALVRYVIYETKGGISVVLEDGRQDPPLVQAGLEGATAFSQPDG